MKGVQKTWKRFVSVMSPLWEHDKISNAEPAKTIPADPSLTQKKFRSLVKEGGDLPVTLDEAATNYVRPTSIDYPCSMGIPGMQELANPIGARRQLPVKKCRYNHSFNR